MNDIEKLMLKTGESDEMLLQLLYDDATEFVLSYTGRTKVVSGMQKAIRDLAIIALNRMGTEGESARSEAGESYNFDDIPDHIKCVLNRYRLARIGGKVYEAKKEPDE